MIDPLDILWRTFDTPETVFTSADVATWPDGALDWLVQSDLLKLAASASHVACPDCPDGHVEEVISRQTPDGMTRFFIECPEYYQVEIRADLLRQWQPNHMRLARRVKEVLRMKARVRATVEDRLWHLGATKWGNRPRELYLARGLGWPDGRSVLERCARRGRPVVLIGLIPPPVEVIAGFSPVMVPLPSVLSLAEGQLQIDHELLAQLIAECDQIVGVKGGIDFDELRSFVSRCVERQMVEGPVLGVIAAGVNQGLSSREIEADLKMRGIPLDHSTIARVIQHAKEAMSQPPPSSSKSVLRPGSSQPRDKRGKPIADAQPKEQ